MKRIHWIILIVIALVLIGAVLVWCFAGNGESAPQEPGSTETTASSQGESTEAEKPFPDETGTQEGTGSAGPVPDGETQTQPETQQQDNTPQLPEDVFEESDLPTATEDVESDTQPSDTSPVPDYGGIVLPDDNLEDLQ